MDLDKLKQVAKDTFKIMSGKIDEFTPENTAQARPHIEDDFDDFSMPEDVMGQTRKFDMKDALNRVKKNAMSVKETISDIISDDENQDKDDDKGITSIFKSKKTAELDDVHQEITELKKALESNARSQKSVETSLANIERKLNDISASLTGVNKINDSIFDLKNSQINTKNTMSELEVSFRKFKKKIASGVVIISVISAVIAVLEIINLLS